MPVFRYSACTGVQGSMIGQEQQAALAPVGEAMESLDDIIDRDKDSDTHIRPISMPDGSTMVVHKDSRGAIRTSHGPPSNSAWPDPPPQQSYNLTSFYSKWVLLPSSQPGLLW